MPAAVEQLAIVEGPLAGLGQEAPGPITQAANWMRSHNICPTMVTTGAVVGGLAAAGLAGGVTKGAVGAAAASWIYQRLTGMPTNTLAGVGLAGVVAYFLSR